MNVRKTDEFLSDVERQYEWYVVNAGREIADRYIEAVRITYELLSRHPWLGPPAGFAHPRLRDWRFLLVFRPFKKHILYYEILHDEIILRRIMHGQRDLLRRLLEPS